MRLASWLVVEQMKAEGTSDGAKKGWDTRGRSSEGKYPVEETRYPSQMDPDKARALIEKLRQAKVKEVGDPGHQFAMERKQMPGQLWVEREDASVDPTDSTEKDATEEDDGR